MERQGIHIARGLAVRHQGRAVLREGEDGAQAGFAAARVGAGAEQILQIHGHRLPGLCGEGRRPDGAGDAGHLHEQVVEIHALQHGAAAALQLIELLDFRPGLIRRCRPGAVEEILNLPHRHLRVQQTPALGVCDGQAQRVLRQGVPVRVVRVRVGLGEHIVPRDDLAEQLHLVRAVGVVVLGLSKHYPHRTPAVGQPGQVSRVAAVHRVRVAVHAVGQQHRIPGIHQIRVGGRVGAVPLIRGVFIVEAVGVRIRERLHGERLGGLPAVRGVEGDDGGPGPRPAHILRGIHAQVAQQLVEIQPLVLVDIPVRVVGQAVEVPVPQAVLRQRAVRLCVHQRLQLGERQIQLRAQRGAPESDEVLGEIRVVIGAVRGPGVLEPGLRLLADIDIRHIGESVIVIAGAVAIQVIDQAQAAVVVGQVVHIAQGVLPLRLGVKDERRGQASVRFPLAVRDENRPPRLVGRGDIRQGELRLGGAVAVFQLHLVRRVREEDPVVPVRHLVEHIVQIHALVDKPAGAVLVDPPEQPGVAVLQLPHRQRDAGHHARALHREGGAGDGVHIVRQLVVVRHAAVVDVLVFRCREVNGAVVDLRLVPRRG